MAFDWSEAAAGVGGGVLVTLVSWLLGRSDTAKDRREKEVRTIAVAAVEESEKFVLAGEQQLINAQVREGVESVRRTVEGLDQKFDTFLLSGRIPIKRDPNQT